MSFIKVAYPRTGLIVKIKVIDAFFLQISVLTKYKCFISGFHKGLVSKNWFDCQKSK